MPRYEVLYPGCLAVLTNAPDGLRLCVGCGKWQPEAEVPVETARCRACRDGRVQEPPRTYMDQPADLAPVACVVCGTRFVPSRMALREAGRRGYDETTNPWCCSPRCVGHRGGTAAKKKRTED
jgi:hypothetical protein